MIIKKIDETNDKVGVFINKAFAGRGYSKITLTTFGFLAPEFYKKLGYELEFLRNDNDAKLCKYFYIKSL